ncbi:MAG: ABC transporter substrate-binding protein [Rhizobiales bacterium]|nr:ABC transporter substrate-binding protein [Hyphomicrobiales bacterium]
MKIPRRIFIGGSLAALLPTGTMRVLAEGEKEGWRSSSSLVRPSKYGDAFAHYDYVNPAAPKGGETHSVSIGTFDSFNPFIVRGTPGAGLGSFGGDLYDTLMKQANDEPGVSHALIAEAFKFPEDYSSATYRLNAKARWHDGKPITAEDVVWSFNFLKANSPLYTRYFANVTEAVTNADGEVEFRFNQKGNRELPHIMGDLAVLPKHWWEGTDGSGKKRDATAPTLEPPLGSGPYKIGSFRAGSEIVWARVEDYWAADLGVNAGRNNFDRKKYVYFRDENAAWEAFTKGGYDDFRVENRSQRWATGYDFPAFKAGDVIKREYETTAGKPMQCFVMNMRHAQFKDRRVREALTFAFDFEDMNRTLFYNSYKRTQSYFQGTELASRGLPEGKELEILNAVKDEVPPEVFTKEFKLPVYDTPQSERTNLRQAFELLKQAGWQPKGRTLVNDKGERFTIVFLGNDPSDERVVGPFIANLRKLGIDASLRIVDVSQYVNRVRSFDFDMVTTVMMQSESPGNEQRDFWSSAAADAPGSRNLMGIKNPAVDKLVDRVIFTKDRDDLVAATRALDRVLLWNYYVVPQWYAPGLRVAYWNKFGIPEKQPGYIGVDFDSWWIDEAKAAALAKKYKSRD